MLYMFVGATNATKYSDFITRSPSYAQLFPVIPSYSVQQQIANYLDTTWTDSPLINSWNHVARCP